MSCAITCSSGVVEVDNSEVLGVHAPELHSFDYIAISSNFMGLEPRLSGFEPLIPQAIVDSLQCNISSVSVLFPLDKNDVVWHGTVKQS